MNNLEDILAANLSGKNGSLIYELHENEVLNIELMEEFYSVAKAILETIPDGDLKTSLVAKLYSVYVLIWKYFAFHFDTNDGFKISNLTPDLYGEVVDELEYIFDVKKMGLI